MRAGAAHKRDVLPHSISGLRSIRWLAPWAPARAVVIGWAQRLGARWHSGRQLLGSEAEQNEYNRNINLGACGSSATERISASTAAVWTRVSPLASPYRSVLLAYGPPSQLLPPLPALGLLQRQLPQRSRTECGPCLSPPLLPTSPLDTTGAVRDEHATIDTPSLPCVAITTSWGSVGHLFDVAMPLYLIAVSSSSRLLALARPAVQRLWQEVQCASTSVSAVWTSETEPAISDVGGPWRNINVRGIEDRPHVPDALIRVNAARPPNGPIAAPQGGAPAAAPGRSGRCLHTAETRPTGRSHGKSRRVSQKTDPRKNRARRRNRPTPGFSAMGNRHGKPQQKPYGKPTSGICFVHEWECQYLRGKEL